jgi:hypothetical protein
MPAKKRITKDTIAAHAAVFELILGELQPFSDWRADSMKRSIGNTLKSIGEVLSVADPPQSEFRSVLAGLQQGFRDTPKVLYWLPPDALRRISEKIDRLKPVED